MRRPGRTSVTQVWVEGKAAVDESKAPVSILTLEDELRFLRYRLARLEQALEIHGITLVSSSEGYVVTESGEAVTTSGGEVVITE